MFFIIPCVDTYEKIDMRSRKYEIPPQEVRWKLERSNKFSFNASLSLQTFPSVLPVLMDAYYKSFGT